MLFSHVGRGACRRCMKPCALRSLISTQGWSTKQAWSRNSGHSWMTRNKVRFKHTQKTLRIFFFFILPRWHKFLMSAHLSVDYFQPHDQQYANIKYDGWHFSCFVSCVFKTECCLSAGNSFLGWGGGLLSEEISFTPGVCCVRVWYHPSP